MIRLQNIKQLLEKGFFHIFGANVINKIIQFSSGILVVRILTKEHFGIYSYASNIIAFFLLFSGLGSISGVLQYGSESKNLKTRNSYFKYGIKLGLTFNLLLSFLILLYALFGNLTIPESRNVLILMFLLPIFTLLFEMIQIYMRASILNKNFSYLTIFNSFLLLCFSILGALLYQVEGLVVLRYFAYFLSVLFGIYLIKDKIRSIFTANNLQSNNKKGFIKFSLVSAANNSISQLLYILDLFLIGYFIKDVEIIASYKTATLIPFALNFIPVSIMTFIYPYFARNNKNNNWIKEKYLMLIKYLIPFNFLISLFLILFAPFIIKFIFGIEYLDSILTFRILSFGYFITASFRIPSGNILLMLKKVKFGLYMSIIVGLLNIILDIILVKLMGSTGAALATVTIFLFSSIISTSYLLYLLKRTMIS
ncbi:polysaccharide biosynthesis protein [Orenia metallireducens]|uniref:Polysaccharide biosynthesis protein n=1 Tax=Orenia metallireducens TaxID=1413210 RepID=A0A1C0A631_9FIRM|nr:oligosaccharide flippase family protein [Orenia metallireducens]OCL25569.1 polysaccharide biosynthesis protein [Orenia metallireducens]